ncbi:MAG: tannase/feruloyl esterase family alpha/beta hydrolase [Nocardioides sp.]
MKKKILALGAVAVTLLGAAVVTAGPADAAPHHKHHGHHAKHHHKHHHTKPSAALRCVVPAIKAPAGATVVSATATAKAGGTLTFASAPGFPATPPVTDVPAFCQVDVTLTHDGTDRELIQTWLPKTGWTGRFEALGGSGYLAGGFGPDQATAIKQGYAVGTTDAGALPSSGFTADWALRPDGTVNTTVLTNFAERGPHELALVGQAVTKAYYTKAASYSYWNGCSTGGRQGYMEAQRHPGDFDGVLANAPAVGWDRFAPADLWPAVVESAEGDQLAPCELNAFTAAAVQACDGPIKDGIIDEPLACGFDPHSIVGQQVVCDGQTLTITAKDADVIAKIWDGPRTTTGERLGWGLTKGADLTALAAAPFPVAASWIQNFLLHDPKADVSHLSYAEYERLFAQSKAEYHAIIGSDDANLAPFRAAGGKLLTWQGGDDQLIPVADTIEYYGQVKQELGNVDDFYRFFVVPGASHCRGGVGPAPTDPLGALVSWVEKGKAPATLTAGTRTVPFFRG